MAFSAMVGGALIGGFATDWDPWGVIGGGLLGYGGGAFLGAGSAGASLGGAGAASLGGVESLAGGIGYGEIGASLAGGAADFGLGEFAGAGISAIGGGGAAAGFGSALGAAEGFGLGSFADAGIAGIGGFGGGSAATDFGLGSYLSGYGGAELGFGGGASLGGAAVPGAGATAGGGILPSSVANIAEGIRGLPWGGIAQTQGLLSNFMNIAGMGDYKKRLQQASQVADPFGPQRAQYQQQLSALMANPSSVTQLPGYQAQLDASLQALQRTQAAQGGLGGGQLKELTGKLGAEMQRQFYNEEVARLTQLAGGNIGGAPAAGQILASGAGNIVGGQGQNLANLTYGLQNIANITQQQPTATPNTPEEDMFGQNIQAYLF